MAIPRALDVPFRMRPDGASPSVIEGDAVLDRSIRTIIRTVPGERAYRPNFGCWVSLLLFANMTEGNAFQAGDEIKRAVSVWEPRVIITNITFELKNSNTINLVVEWHRNGKPATNRTVEEFRV